MTDQGPPRHAVDRLRIWRAFTETYATVLGTHLRHMPRALFGPVLIGLVLFAINHTFGVSAFSTMTADPGASADLFAGQSTRAVVVNFVVSLLGVVPYCIFSVTWHRLVLLGPVAARPSLMPAWGGRHWRYLGYGILITIISYAILLPAFIAIGFATGAGGTSEVAVWPLLLGLALFLIAFFVTPYLFMRLSFVLAAVCLDERYGLGDSWRQTRGQGLRLFALGVLVSVPIIVASLALSSAYLSIYFAPLFDATTVPSPIDIGPSFLAFSFLLWIFYFVAIALIVTMISVAFRNCSGWISPTSQIVEVF